MFFFGLMSKEFFAFQKSFSTLLALVVLHAVHFPQVEDQIVALGKAFATLGAFEWIEAQVVVEVPSQIGWKGERLLAQVALMLALAINMLQLVFVEASIVGKPFVANVTLEGSRARVAHHMLLHG